MKNAKKLASLTIVLLFAATVFVSISSTFVNAQTSGTAIVMYSSIGGTTNPPPGTTQYLIGTVLTITATPDAGYTFDHWIYMGPDIPYSADSNVTGSSVYYDNPLTITCGDGWTLYWQPVFTPSSTYASNTGDTAIVMYSSIGGTTNPPAGTTQYAVGTVLTLTATPNAGYVFDHWAYLGPNIPYSSNSNVTGSNVYYDNPLTITCGNGWTLNWQPVFVPSSAASVSGVSIQYVIAAVVGVAAIVGVAAFLVGRRSK